MTGNDSLDPVAIVMAAGKSTRMKSDLPKVLHELCGQPLLTYVLTALRQARIRRILVVVGFGANQVQARFAQEPGVEFVLQKEQKGTGHAVQMCRDTLEGHLGPVVVLAGDGPMVRSEMLGQMLQRFHAYDAAAFLATAVVQDPFGLGRIVRDDKGEFNRIVEQRDATPEEAAVREINASFYVFDGPSLFRTLDEVKPNNAQGEYYITDVPGMLKTSGESVVAEVLADEADMFGINHRQHLGEAHAIMQQRILNQLMEAGVTIVDPRNTYIDARAHIGLDTVIEPFTVLRGPVTVGRNCRIGPFALLQGEVSLPDNSVVASFTQLP